MKTGWLVLANLLAWVWIGATLAGEVPRGPAPSSSGGRPLVSVAPTGLTLGPVAPGRSAFGGFTVTNQGSALLMFRVESSCNCLVVNQLQDQLAPGASARVNLRFSMNLPGEFTREVYVLSNDTGHAAVAVPVRLTVSTP